MQQHLNVSILSVTPIERLISSEKLPFPPTLTKLCSSISAFPTRAVQDLPSWPKRCHGGFVMIRSTEPKWRNGHELLFMLFTKVLKIESGSLSIKPSRDKWGYLSFRYQKASSSQEVVITQALKHVASLSSLNSPPTMQLPKPFVTSDHLHTLDYNKENNISESFVITWDWREESCNSHTEASPQAKPISFWLKFQVHLSASNAFLKAVTFFSHFMFTV